MTGSDLPVLLGIRIGGKFDCYHSFTLFSVEFLNGMFYVSASLLTDLLIIYSQRLILCKLLGKREGGLFILKGLQFGNVLEHSLPT